MESSLHKIALAAAACAAVLSFQSCDGQLAVSGEGILEIRFVEMKATVDMPDTNNFLISVTDSYGNVIFDGRYSDSPDRIITDAGSYSISARSCVFDAPAFDTPQYGDDRTAVVVKGQSTTVNLECRQINAGMRLRIEDSFKYWHPKAELLLKAPDGTLIYGYDEKRTAYFKPGSVVLQMIEDGSEQSLFTRRVEAQQILTVSLSSAEGGNETGSGIKIGVDTTRTWLSDSYVLGGQGGSEPSDAIGVRDAKERAGAIGIWVYGYIVGGDLSSSRCSFEAPFTSRTNIAIAAKSNCTDKESCLSVQLSKGDIRDALNLVDNPSNLGRQVYLKGDIVASYYGITGIQNLSEFLLK